MDMSVENKNHGVAIVLKISGEIDLYNAMDFKDTIKARADENKNVVLNMKGVTYIDSSGIGSIIASFSDVKKAGGTLKLCEINDAVKQIFELTKLESFFEIFESEELALESYKK